MKEYQYPVVIEYDPEDDVYLADCPLIAGCYSDDKTYEEALVLQRKVENRCASLGIKRLP